MKSRIPPLIRNSAPHPNPQIPGPLMEFRYIPSPATVLMAAIRREMLKQQIREEILAQEAAERREVEQEVRQELDKERPMGMVQQQQLMLAGSGREGVFVGRDELTRVDPSSSIREVDEEESPVSRLTQVNQSQPPLTKMKRKGDAVAGSTKVARAGERNWLCDLCEVSTSSEEGMNEHLNGKQHQTNVSSLSSKGTRTTRINEHLKKKHQANAGSLPSKATGATASSAFVTTRKSGSSSASTPKVSATSLQEDGDSESKKLTMIVNGKRHQVLKKDNILWCEICSVKCNCTELMAGHLGGKNTLPGMENQMLAYLERNLRNILK